MTSQTYKNFQIGMVDDPSVEDQGGFEFASGMDVFSEPGVMKAADSFGTVSYGVGAAPTALPSLMVDTADASNNRIYVVAGAKILESTDGNTFNLFLTNANGTNLGLCIFNGYVWYASSTKLGRAPVGNAAAKDDSWQTIDSDTEFHPMVVQAGQLKVGCGRYIAVVDEADSFTAQAMKLPVGYRIKTLSPHMGLVFMGTRFGLSSGGILTHNADVFAWKGTVLSSGTALPDYYYPLKLLGMNALFSDGGTLYGFPGPLTNIHVFDGSQFAEFRKLTSISAIGGISASHGSVAQNNDNTILFSGAFNSNAGVYQMKKGAVCQIAVPSTTTPGSNDTITVGFVRAAAGGRVFIGYNNITAGTYHIEQNGGVGKQTASFIRTLYHRAQTDKLKRWGGVKLNLKPLGTNNSVAVGYRTSRDASFTDSGYTITSANQDKPVMFAAQPRSREIQYKFTFTTTTTETPQLLSYDPIFEVLKIR